MLGVSTLLNRYDFLKINLHLAERIKLQQRIQNRLNAKLSLPTLFTLWNGAADEGRAADPVKVAQTRWMLKVFVYQVN
jgi:hypothetical protein